MYHGNGRPLSKKKTVQIMVLLTILAWATQTLRHQWGFGSEVQFVPSHANPETPVAGSEPAPSGDSDDAVAPTGAPAPGEEKFVPGSARFAAGATLEIRSEATITGSEVKLKQVCRWCEADKPVFAPFADFVLVRIAPGVPFRGVSVQQIKSILHDAGVNLAAINFVGAAACTVSRTDVAYDEHTALQQWIDAREGNAPTTAPAQVVFNPGAPDVTTRPAAKPQEADSANPYHSLRDRLVMDVATRLNLPVEDLQITFHETDEKLLSLSEPHFHFDLQPRRVRELGPVSWDVVVSADGGSHKATIDAEARAWQSQLVIARPLAARQVLRDEDVVERRILADRMPQQQLLNRQQAVGQQASRELEPGVILDSRSVDPVQLVKAGQFVTVVLTEGGVQIKTVARALEAGSFGQSIRVKNETTRDVFQITLTGPQTGTMEGGAPLAAAQ